MHPVYWLTKAAHSALVFFLADLLQLGLSEKWNFIGVISLGGIRVIILVWNWTIFITAKSYCCTLHKLFRFLKCSTVLKITQEIETKLLIHSRIQTWKLHGQSVVIKRICENDTKLTQWYILVNLVPNLCWQYFLWLQEFFCFKWNWSGFN